MKRIVGAFPFFTAFAWVPLSVGCGGSPNSPSSDIGASGGVVTDNGSSGTSSASGDTANVDSSGTSSSGTSSSESGSSSGVVSNTGSSGSGASSGESTDAGSSSESGSASGMPSESGGSGGSSGAGGNSGNAIGGGSLNPNVAPGGNFDLSIWELQEPIGSAGSPTTILPSQLQGPNGFHDTYFFTDPTDGSMTFWDPEKGVTTPNSKFPRSELREMTAAGATADWPTSGTNTLSATLKATEIPSHVCVGQIHVGTGTPSSVRPLLELFYYATGAIDLAIEQTPAGGNEVSHSVGKVAVGTQWSYEIDLSGSTITMIINGTPQMFPMPSSFAKENMYFKAGDYDQSSGSSTTVGAKVQFYSLKVVHSP